MARDNTVKYSTRTLQLLPGTDRPSYAGLQVEIHENLEGPIPVQYLGQVIPTQEAPRRPGLLRADAARAQGGGEGQWGMAANGLSQERLATMETGNVDRPRRTHKSRAKLNRQPTPRQRNIWKSVQEAKLGGLSLWAIARELNIHGETAEKYALADSPPVRRTATAILAQQPDRVPTA